MHAQGGSGGPGQQDHGVGGWHPDPLRRYELRYFNGRDWTADVAVGGQRFVDPLPLNVTAPGQPVGGPPTPASTGLATAALVVGICSAAVAWAPFMVVLGIIGAFVALGLAIPALRRSRHNGGVGRGRSVAALWLVVLALVLSIAGVALTVVTVHEFDQYTNPGAYTLTTKPCTAANGVITFDGTIRNDSTKRRDYTLTVVYHDPNRRQIVSSQVEVQRVAPGEVKTWTESRPTFDVTATCEVSDVSGPTPFGLDLQNK